MSNEMDNSLGTEWDVKRIKDPARRPQPRRSGRDYWATIDAGLHAALEQHILPGLPWRPIWEFAAGRGHLVRTIRSTGRSVIATDLYEYAPEGIERRDFLHDSPPPEAADCIALTNAPNSLWDKFLARGLSLLDRQAIRGLVLLLRHDYLQSSERVDAFNRINFAVYCNWRALWVPGTTRRGRWSYHWIAWLPNEPYRKPVYLKETDLTQGRLAFGDS
jgi:hypothetical protein